MAGGPLSTLPGDRGAAGRRHRGAQWRSSPRSRFRQVSEWEDPDYFLAGLDLYRAGKAPRLLFTGGSSPFRPGHPPEGQRYLQEVAQLGIPLVAMVSTPPAVNTAKEAIAISRLLGRKTSTSTASSPCILLVTSAFHMRRAQRP